MPRKKSLLPIGIHLNLRGVHMVQMEQSEAAAVAVARASRAFRPLPEKASDEGEKPTSALVSESAKDGRYQEIREFVKVELNSGKFHGAEAVISLPAETLVIQHVRMSPMQPEELLGALPWELRDKLPFDPKEAVIRHLVTGTVTENNETKQDVVALATRRATVEKHVEAMGRIGLRIVGVSVEPCAMCYPYAFAAMHAPASQEGPSSLMLAHLGPLSTHVAIVQGQEISFIKEMGLGTRHLTAALAKARNISLAEAADLRARWRTGNPSPEAIQEGVQAYNSIRYDLGHFVDEVESCMRYHTSLARGARVNRLLFLGEEAHDKALVRVIGAGLSIPCEVGDPVALVGEMGKRDAVEPELAVAVGLGLFSAN